MSMDECQEHNQRLQVWHEQLCALRDDLTAVVEAPAQLAAQRFGSMAAPLLDHAEHVTHGMHIAAKRAQRSVHSAVLLAECRVHMGWLHGGSALGEWTIDGVVQAAAHRSAWNDIENSFKCGWAKHRDACLAFFQESDTAVSRIVTDAAAATRFAAEAARDELRRVVDMVLADASRPLETEAGRIAALLDESKKARAERAAMEMDVASQRAEWHARQMLHRKREDAEKREREEAMAAMLNRAQAENARERKQHSAARMAAREEEERAAAEAARADEQRAWERTHTGHAFGRSMDEDAPPPTPSTASTKRTSPRTQSDGNVVGGSNSAHDSHGAKDGNRPRSESEDPLFGAKTGFFSRAWNRATAGKGPGTGSANSNHSRDSSARPCPRTSQAAGGKTDPGVERASRAASSATASPGTRATGSAHVAAAESAAMRAERSEEMRLRAEHEKQRNHRQSVEREQVAPLLLPFAFSPWFLHGYSYMWRAAAGRCVTNHALPLSHRLKLCDVFYMLTETTIVPS